ncbi:MAG TPA: DUF882 domain-containing protein [Kofleriaceae bacterium]|jgi:uncharacterized protein YcbK (DUF882 family)
MRRSALLIAAVLAFAAGSASADKAAARRSVNDKGTMRQCSERGGKKACRRVAVFQGHNAAVSSLRTEPLERPSGNIWVRAENLGEEFQGNIYKPDGSFDDAVLARLDDLWRDTRSGDVRAVRAELYEHLSRICDHYAGHRIDLVSGFRFHERDSSRHFHASAMDIRIKDVSIRELYGFAETLDLGPGIGLGQAGALGIGIYPVSQFIHVDFRAPGEPSYRWTDWSGHDGGKKKSPGRTQPARKPVS